MKKRGSDKIESKLNKLIKLESEELRELKQRQPDEEPESSKKKISIVIDFNEISKLKGKEKAIRLEKLIQNIKICKKAKCQIKIASFAGNKEELVDELSRKSLGTSLGMSSEQTRDGIEF